MRHSLFTPDDVRTREEAAARCTKVFKRRALKKTSKESQSAALGEMLFDAFCKRKASRNPLAELYVDGHFEKNDKKKNYRDIVKRYTRIRKGQKRSKGKKNRFLKGTSSSQWTGAMQRSHLTWCCKSWPDYKVNGHD